MENLFDATMDEDNYGNGDENSTFLDEPEEEVKET